VSIFIRTPYSFQPEGATTKDEGGCLPGWPANAMDITVVLFGGRYRKTGGISRKNAVGIARRVVV